MNCGVLDFYTGPRVQMHDAIDRHHTLPRSQLPEKTRAGADNMANIAFIIGDVNRSIGNTGPKIYLKKLPERVRRSQCIPDAPATWNVDAAEAFWAERRELLAISFNAYVRTALADK